MRVELDTDGNWAGLGFRASHAIDIALTIAAVAFALLAAR